MAVLVTSRAGLMVSSSRPRNIADDYTGCSYAACLGQDAKLGLTKVPHHTLRPTLYRTRVRSKSGEIIHASSKGLRPSFNQLGGFR